MADQSFLVKIILNTHHKCSLADIAHNSLNSDTVYAEEQQHVLNVLFTPYRIWWIHPDSHRVGQGVKNIGRWTHQQDCGKSWHIEYQLAMLWRHRRAFTRKFTGFETTIVITCTILKLNLWDFLMTSTIVLLKLLISCKNSVGLLFCHYDGQKIEKIVSLLMRYEN